MKEKVYCSNCKNFGVVAWWIRGCKLMIKEEGTKETPYGIEKYRIWHNVQCEVDNKYNSCRHYEGKKDDK
jgi:hypothetical protein